MGELPRIWQPHGKMNRFSLISSLSHNLRHIIYSRVPYIIYGSLLGLRSIEDFHKLYKILYINSSIVDVSNNGVIMEMPAKGWTTVSVPHDLYLAMTRFIDAYNKKVGFKRFRSVSHLVEEAVADFVDFRVVEVKS